MAGEALTFTRLDWSPEVAAGLSRAMGDDSELIANEVKAGIAECWRIKNHGLMVTRLELDNNALVLVAGEGRGMVQILEAMPALAKANGVDLVRFHSKRKGMARLIKRLNYDVAEGHEEKIYYGR